MYWIYVFINYLNVLLFLNSCIYSIYVYIILEFMYLLFLNTLYILFLTIYVLFINISRHVFCYIDALHVLPVVR